MTGFKRALTSEIRETDELIAKISEEIGTLQDGELRSTGIGSQYTELKDGNGRFRRLDRTDPGEARRVSDIRRFRYDQCALKVLTENRKWLERLTRHFQDAAPDSIIGALPPVYRPSGEDLEHLWFKDMRESDVEWIKRNNCRNKKYPEHLAHRTSFGVNMRSKSEVIIAELLHAAGVVFRYEPEVILYDNGTPVTLYPDFEIRLGENRSVYWEHLGMLGDGGYRDMSSWKFNIYNENGILPWRGLIMTFDDAEGGIDVEEIQAIIEGLKYLIK